MARRYRPGRRGGSLFIPITAITFTAGALLLWSVYVWGEDVLNYFKGKTVVVADNSEANNRLTALLADLSGNKADLLELAENSQARLGWIENEQSRRLFRWYLMCNLIDKGLWTEAVAILPEVESLAPVEGLERLAIAALEHNDHQLQLRLDRQLQERVVNMPDGTHLLLRSIRRTAETCVSMNLNDEAVKAIARLENKSVLARLKNNPALAAEAAALQMIRADISTIKDPVLQQVRNILEQAGWPSCPATSRLMIEEVSTLLNSNSNISQSALKEIENKLLRCRDSLLEHPDRDHRLPECYMMLGELRFRMADYPGCVQALTLAGAFADGYGEMTPALQVRICRIRSRAHEAQGNTSATVDDCRFLLEHATDAAEIYRCLSILAQHEQGEEQMKLLMRCWGMLKETPKLSKNSDQDLALIATRLSNYFIDTEQYENALQWLGESNALLEKKHPDITDGKLLRARHDQALILRKAKQDSSAIKLQLELVRAIEKMSEEERARLDAADGELYKDAIREFSRSYLLIGEKKLARDVIRKIGESLPEKTR